MRAPALWVVLAALALMGGGASERSSAAAGSSLRFRDVAVESGIRFHHFNGATGDLLLPEIMGSGVAVFDFDGDGDLDILVMQGDLLDPAKTMARCASSPPPGPWNRGPRLFRNELVPSGSFRFTDVTGGPRSVSRHTGWGSPSATLTMTATPTCS